MKKHLLTALSHAGLPQVSRAVFKPAGAVIMLHRVIRTRPSDEFQPNALWQVTAAQLEEFIITGHAAGFEFVDLNTAITRLSQTSASQTRKPFICLTFDDGYKDNYTLAYPICERFGVPMTVYVTTGLIRRQAVAWWELLERVIARNERLQGFGSADTGPFHTRTVSEKRQAFNHLSTALHAAPPEQLRAYVSTLETQACENTLRETASLFLTKEELQAFARLPLVTIGAHTRTHARMSALEASALTDEIAGSKRDLKEILGVTPSHFAYPFGTATDAGDREFAAVEHAGFQSAVTTRHGVIRHNAAHNPFAIPRLGLFPHDTPAVTRLKLAGTTTFLRRMVKAA